jgi:hypothetical protein
MLEPGSDEEREFVNYLLKKHQKRNTDFATQEQQSAKNS